MNKLMRSLGYILLIGMITTGCDSVTDNELENNRSLETIEGMTMNVSPACEETDSGLTANYINEVPNGPFAVTCDIGLYFNEDIKANRAELYGTVADAKSTQYGIYVDGVNVDISNSTVITEADYPHQFISVAYFNGATGTLSRSELSGAHRVGLLVRGENTEITARGNEITGTGAKTSGWAENGIQADQGAKADIRNNTISDHWWDGESNWSSAGIYFMSNNSSVTNNTLIDNEVSSYVLGDGNSYKSNKISSDVETQSSLGFVPWGVLVLGSDNDITGNRLTATDGASGIYVYAGSEGNKLTGNRISGFDDPISDNGNNTMEKGNPSVFN